MKEVTSKRNLTMKELLVKEARGEKDLKEDILTNALSLSSHSLVIILVIR